MKKMLSFSLLCMFASPPGVTLLANPAEDWKIEAVLLTPDTDPAHRLPADTIPQILTVTVSNPSEAARFQLSSDVRLTRIRDSFVAGNRFVAMGEAGSADEVAVFDIVSKRLIDWFYCYAPHRVSANWIAYVEWYQGHGLAHPKEVLLMYDLAETPAENRLPSAGRLPVPAPLANGPVQVGIPVYPETNVLMRSYINVVEGSGEGDVVMQEAGYVLLPLKRLVFAAAQGEDFLHLRNYLVIVNLSGGVNHPAIETIDIPKDQFKKAGENPRFVKITGIEQASENAVRLFVPQSDYGVSSITVAIPGS